MDTLDLELVPETPRIGKDELNLTEFPFALLHSRPPKNAPLTLEFKDGDKEWTVEGSPKYGLPMAPDIAVYIVLMEITREQSFPNQVEFCRRNLIRRLGWDPNGRSYERLTLSLDRLVSVTIRTRNAFYDARNRRWSSKEAFHILERYKIMDGTLPGQDQASLFPSWVRWSPEISANIQAGYIKSLNVDLFLSLRSAISQALYRYLDKKRGGDGKPVFRIALKTLVFEHLGMSRSYYPSEAKHKLKPAHEELIAAGFLSGIEFAPMKNGEEMVVYRFAPRPEPNRSRPGARREAEGRSLPAALSPLAQRLVDAGVSRQTAQELSAAAPEECERQLQLLPYREARDPGAVLAKSIREGWAAPPAWTEAQARKKRAEKAQQQRLQASEQEEKRARVEGEFDAYWAKLPPRRRQAVEAEALAELRRTNKVLADFAGKHPDSPMLREALRPYLKRLSGWALKREA
jgi:plasmid replication initiation protein